MPEKKQEEKPAVINKSRIGSSETRQVCAALVTTLGVFAAYSSDCVGAGALTALQTFVHLLATCTLFGMQAWVSFFGGLALFKSLPRKYFGMAQAAQFPVYFRTGFFLSFVLFFSCVMSHPPSSANGSDLFQMGAILVQSACLFFSSYYIVPRARKQQMFMYSMEGASAEVNMGSNVPKEIMNIPRYAQIRKEFGKLHGVSILLNITSLLIITGHVFYLSRGLKL